MSIAISLPVATIDKSAEAVIVSPFMFMLSTSKFNKVPNEVTFVWAAADAGNKKVPVGAV